MRALERVGVVAGTLLLVVLPTALHEWPSSVRGTVSVLLLVAGGCALAGWRTHPRLAAVVSLGSFLLAAGSGAYVADPTVALLSCGCAVLALGWSGRAAWVVAVVGVAYLVALFLLTRGGSEVAVVMFTVPPYAAGTVLRLRRETADALALRLRELEEERELYAEIALRHERARIAGELHDIVGHAISVMVVQAAAGQRLVDRDPVRAREAFAAIAESAREGTQDLERLVALLGDATPASVGGADLALVDEVVARASRSGLDVTCRFEGERDGVPAPVAHLAYRVVQESLTNALRHAPGARVEIAIRVDDAGHGLDVRVENGGTASREVPLTGTGRGLVGLRERVQALGGRFSAGATAAGGWAVRAHLPVR